jgi:hypothetical protein
LVIQLGKLDRNRIGAIQVHGRAATVEVPDAWGIDWPRRSMVPIWRID